MLGEDSMADNVVVNVNCGQQAPGQKPDLWEEWKGVVTIVVGIVMSFAAGNGCMAFVKRDKTVHATPQEELRIRGEIARLRAEDDARGKICDARIKIIESEKIS